MLTTISLVQLGVGGVGRALIEQVLATRDAQARYGLHLQYTALVDSSGVVFDPHGVEEDVVRDLSVWKADGNALVDHDHGQADDDLWLTRVLSPSTIIIDTTAAEPTVVVPLFEATLEQGGAVVLANKKPIADTQATWDALMRHGRLGYEATVGAGLPVISTVRQLLDTGDTVTRIEGAFSGTLGYLMTALQGETPFSEAVRYAKVQGWTEPDPRDDLGGMDIARKALILARTLGWQAEMDSVEVEPLFPPEYSTISVKEFMGRLEELDASIAEKVTAAHADGQRWRYVASVRPERLAVGSTTVSPDSPVGSLRGSDNLIAFYTERYGERPLVIQGAGAGIHLTASAVLNDVLRLGQRFAFAPPVD